MSGRWLCGCRMCMLWVSKKKMKHHETEEDLDMLIMLLEGKKGSFKQTKAAN